MFGGPAAATLPSGGNAKHRERPVSVLRSGQSAVKRANRRRGAKPVFRRRTETSGSARRPEKDGRASGRRWRGRYGGTLVRKGSAARSRRGKKAFS